MTEFPERGSANPRQMKKVKDYIDSRPGASETAVLVSRGNATSTDWNADVGPIPFAYVDGTPQRDWLILGEDGSVTLGDDAGGCFVCVRVSGSVDFSAASDVPTINEIMYVAGSLKWNGGSPPGGSIPTSATMLADGESDLFDLPDSAAKGSFVVGGVLTVNTTAAHEDVDGTTNRITDGAALVDVLLSITRVSPAPPSFSEVF